MKWNWRNLAVQNLLNLFPTVAPEAHTQDTNCTPLTYNTDCVLQHCISLYAIKCYSPKISTWFL